jgi:glycosyltransferase involved in cell wall biosynthesis
MAHVLVLAEGLPYPFDPRIRGQVAALVEAGWSVTVAGPTGPGAERREEIVDGVDVLRFVAPQGGRGAAGYLREYGLAWVRLRRLVARIRRSRDVDVVLVCGPPDSLAILALPFARRGAGVVFDLREISPELFEAKFGRRGPLHKLLLASERFALRHADAVITVSEPCAEIARARGGVPAGRIFHVGNGPDPKRIFPVAPREELRRGHEHLVLWLGCMSSQEGLTRLVAAADHLVNDDGRRDVQFALVGPGDVHDELRGEVRARGLEDAVFVSGQVDDDSVRAYMSTADVCVNVDERNAMNDRAAMRKVMEYMAAGRAVVQFPLTEMRRICGDATAYARNADARDLADRIAELLDDPERRARLGHAARERARADLMWPAQVPAFLAAVDLALSAHAPARALAPDAVCGT